MAKKGKKVTKKVNEAKEEKVIKEEEVAKEEKKVEEKKEPKENKPKKEEKPEVKEEKKAKEEFYEDEEEKKEKSLFSRVINVILWIVLFVWMGICLVDFFKTRALSEPIFCLSKETTEYSDGKVYSCTGLGYKIYHYDRKSFKGYEYGPFWAKDRSAEQKVEAK